MSYNIISFDGGGVCGTFSVRLLQRIMEKHPNLLQSVDLFAGTSTGGLIALGMAHGISVESLLQLYQKETPTIFARNIFRKMLGNILAAKYSNAGIISVAKKTFGGTATLGDLSCHVVVPSFNLKEDGTPTDPSWRCEFFHNFAGSPYMNEKVVDVAIRTASAPTYFPSYQGYIDGGVVANDPSLAAVAHAVAHGFKLEDIRVLSIGTGGQIRYLVGDDIKWGLAGWAKSLVGVFMDGQSITVDTLSSLMLGQRYLRLCPIIPLVEMHDVSKVDELITDADKVNLAPITEWLNREFLPEAQGSILRWSNTAA